MQKHRLLVLSLDAVSSKDLPFLQSLPHFKDFFKKGSLIKKVESVSPSLTYPAHTTILTGLYPIHHGIINNTLLEPGSESPNWYWYKKYIKVPTLLDLATAAGYSTCSLLWPVTGKSKITYHLPEIFAAKPWQNQIFQSLSAGPFWYQLKLNQKFGFMRKGLHQPELDDFIIASSLFTLSTYKPEVMFVHLTDVDTIRHLTGFQNEKVKEALERHDKRLGLLIDCLKQLDLYEQTSIILLGDHSQLPVKFNCKLNILFKEEGLITCKSSGKIKDYQAIAKSCDGSSYIYLKDSHDLTTKKKVMNILKNLIQQPNSPIEYYLHREDAVRMGADPQCTFLIEAKKDYAFLDSLEGSFLEDISAKAISKKQDLHLATHGYLTTKPDYTTFFAASGPNIKEGFIKENGKLINHGPTLAYLLGLSLGHTDGVIEKSILKEV